MKQPSTSSKQNLFVLADSISIHYGPYLEGFISNKFNYSRKKCSDGRTLDDNLNVPTSIYGDNGGDSSMVLEYLRFRRQNDPLSHGILLLNCGLHDIKRPPGSDERQIASSIYADNLKSILKEAKSANLLPFWVRTTPVIDEIHNSRSLSFHRFALDVAEYNQIADDIMKSEGIPMIDLHDFTLPFLPEGFCDHVHYTPEIRKLQAAFVAGYLMGHHA